MTLADALGNLADLRRLPGSVRDLRGTRALREGLVCGWLLTGRSFDADWRVLETPLPSSGSARMVAVAESARAQRLIFS